MLYRMFCLTFLVPALALAGEDKGLAAPVAPADIWWDIGQDTASKATASTPRSATTCRPSEPVRGPDWDCPVERDQVLRRHSDSG